MLVMTIVIFCRFLSGVTVQDNRITIRVSGVLLERVDKYREQLSMTRQELVRNCLQNQLAVMASVDSGRDEEIRELNEELLRLRAEYQKLVDYIS
ncbi:hypothetical protein VCRA2122O12_520001 [Vibrio crassostreae]|nr:hypothetical protein VCRA2122O12_520001 [Vibrio crassostreae]